MKNILEQAIVHLLNEENDKANELFHRFMVERARQIHESLRQGEPEACSEEYFTESDLDGIEGDADADMVPAGEDNAEFGASEADAAGDDAAADDLSGDDVDGDNTFGDDAAADDMGGEEETLDDIKASIDELIAKFDEMMGTGDDSDEAAGDDETYGDDDAADDFGGSDDEADDAEDDFTAADDETSEDEMHESEGDDEEGEGDDDFDAITESIIAELEKVNVASGDDKEIGTGKTIGANKSSTLPTSTPEPGDAKPVKINSKNHVGFERETAPASKSLPKGKNTRNRSTDGTEKVSKEGDKSSALNKDFAGSAGNDKSPLAKKGNPF